MSISAYPLCWPSSYPRTAHTKRAPYRASFATARDDLLKELRLLGAEQVVLSSNVPLRQDGIPYAGMAQPRDKGVAVYFRKNGSSVSLVCDRWERVEDNIRAIGLTVFAIRGLERWGCSQMLERVFQGFAALPAPESDQLWHQIIGVDPHASIDEIESAYRQKMRHQHPDVGGSVVVAQKLNAAIQEARRLRAR
jgi:hypothetical protein